MKNKSISYQIGTFVVVQDAQAAAPLPAGLPSGARVKVIGINSSHDDVDFEGVYFRISPKNVCAVLTE